MDELQFQGVRSLARVFCERNVELMFVERYGLALSVLMAGAELRRNNVSNNVYVAQYVYIQTPEKALVVRQAKLPTSRYLYQCPKSFLHHFPENADAVEARQLGLDAWTCISNPLSSSPQPIAKSALLSSALPSTERCLSPRTRSPETSKRREPKAE